jgi:hypothetical protein
VAGRFKNFKDSATKKLKEASGLAKSALSGAKKGIEERKAKKKSSDSKMDDISSSKGSSGKLVSQQMPPLITVNISSLHAAQEQELAVNTADNLPELIDLSKMPPLIDLSHTMTNTNIGAPIAQTITVESRPHVTTAKSSTVLPKPPLRKIAPLSTPETTAMVACHVADDNPTKANQQQQKTKLKKAKKEHRRLGANPDEETHTQSKIGCVLINDMDTEDDNTQKTAKRKRGDGRENDDKATKGGSGDTPKPKKRKLEDNPYKVVQQTQAHIAFKYFSEMRVNNKIVLLQPSRDFGHSVVLKMETQPSFRDKKHKETIYDIPEGINLESALEDSAVAKISGPNFDYFVDENQFHYVAPTKSNAKVTTKIIQSSYHKDTNTLYLFS